MKSALRIALPLLIALTALSSVASAGANSRDGCMNQWLFNGLWRVEVTKVEPYMNGGQQTGWQVTEVWRNGTSQELAPSDSVLKDQQLTLASGTMLASATTTGTMSLSSMQFHSFAPAAQFQYSQIFVAANVDPSDKPKAVDILFDAAKLSQLTLKPQFSTAQHDFHFRLDCVASGAAAQAQGGASEIQARQGCMGQWMSNGIWRMRATAVNPDNNNDPSSPQIGWMITQDWVNLASRPLAPSDVFAQDEYLVTAGGQNVPSSNSAGTSMNQQQLQFRIFAPGSSFTYQQRFRWAGLDPNDKPTKLLVTFDGPKQNARVGQPHYTMPADFRIDLTCTK
ncbi:MAG TPA: hypothetical protein VKT51_03900 [Candidatus Eremiobacteraceae bacterium]|nr:hypothetical protein [Candidatus Eremiobacteraceae bacterium]